MNLTLIACVTKSFVFSELEGSYQNYLRQFFCKAIPQSPLVSQVKSYTFFLKSQIHFIIRIVELTAQSINK